MVERKDRADVRDHAEDVRERHRRTGEDAREEYTSYRETDADADAGAGEDAEAEREAELQPGEPDPDVKEDR